MLKTKYKINCQNIIELKDKQILLSTLENSYIHLHCQVHVNN